MTELIAFALGLVACAIYHAVRVRMLDRSEIDTTEEWWK